MNSLKFVLGIFILLGGAVLFSAQNLDDCMIRVETWINRTYAKAPVTQNYKMRQFNQILETKQTDAEKIVALQKKFPAAFQKEEKPLIYTTPLTWKVHSLALGYDISETAASTEKVSDIVEKISTEQSTEQKTAREDNGSSHNIRDGAGIDGQYSFTPMAWLDGTAGTRISISGSYNYGKNWSSQTSALWSTSRQKLFSEKNSRIKELLQQTTIRNRHLSFTLTVTNNTSEDMVCKLGYIPVKIQGRLLFEANFKYPDYQLTIPAYGTKDIYYKAELDNTKAFELVDYMRHAEPEIAVTRGGLKISSQTHRDAIDSSRITDSTSQIVFSLLQFNAVWNIRLTHTSNDKPVTLREALQAIQADWKKDNKNIFTWEKDRLVAISSVPFGNFAEKDKEKRFTALLRIGDKFYREINATLLDKPVQAEGCEVMIIDLDQLKKLKNASPAFKKAVFETVKDHAKENSDCKYLTYRLADYFHSGYGVEKDPVEAFKWCRKAAEQGHVTACYKMGVSHELGTGTKQDPAKAVTWYRKAADMEYAAAQFRLGRCYYYGIGIKKDYKQAVELFQRSAKQNNPYGQYALALCFANGHGVGKNIREAVTLYQKAADQNVAGAQVDLGLLYYYGEEDVEINKFEAVELWEKAARQNNSRAQFLLGRCHYDGRGGVEQDVNAALSWYTKAADQNFVWSQLALGDHYRKEMNFKEAVKWYTKAADLGSAEGEFQLGDCFEYGVGVEKNINKAEELYRKAARKNHRKAYERLLFFPKEKFIKQADSGDAVSQCILGECYETGNCGVSKDDKRAFEYYQKAAKQGYARAQLFLGRCYDVGVGTAVNLKEAKKWYQKAAAQGCKEAEESLQIVQAKIDMVAENEK